MITLVLALLAALVGPLVRRLEPEQQIRLLVAWSIWLAVVVAVTWHQIRRRLAAEKLVGQRLFRLPTFDPEIAVGSSAGRAANVLMYIFLALVTLSALSLMVIDVSRPAGPHELSLVYACGGFSAAWFVSQAVAMLWWGRSICFAERGILWDTQVVPWNQVVEYQWKTSDPATLRITGVNQYGSDSTFSVAVPYPSRATIDQLLQQPVRDEKTNVDDSELIRRPLLWHDFGREKRIDMVFAGILWVGICIFFFTAIEPRLGLATHAFDEGAVVGLLVVLLESWHRSKLGHRSGACLVRLRVKLNVWGVSAGLLVVIAVTYFAPNLAALNDWIIRSIGCIGSVAGLWTMQAVQSRYVDFRESGIAAQRVLFWPWHEVRLVDWDRESTGRLTLTRGWRRLTANVPRSMRDTVDAVLTAKLGV